MRLGEKDSTTVDGNIGRSPTTRTDMTTIPDVSVPKEDYKQDLTHIDPGSHGHQ